MIYLIIEKIRRIRLLKKLNFSKPLYIHPKAKFVYPKNIYLGKFTRVGANCYLNGEGSIKIGDGTILGPNVTILSSSHNYNQSSYLPYDFEDNKKEVLIGRGCWIGMGAMISPGTKIGDGAVIAMGSVVVRDVADGEIVGGNPAQVIKKRETKIDDLLLHNRYFLRSKITQKMNRGGRKSKNIFKYLIK